MLNISGFDRRLMIGFAAAAWIACGLCSCSSSGHESRPATAEETPGAGIKEVSPQELQTWMSTGKPFTLIDVREDGEWQSGHAATALHIPRATLAGRIPSVVPDKSACVVLYCKGGVRSAAAAVTLREMGYTNVFSLAGGFMNYRQAGLPVQQ